MTLKEHPTVKAYLNNQKTPSSPDNPLKSHVVKAIAQKCRTDDVGLLVDVPGKPWNLIFQCARPPFTSKPQNH